MNGPLPLAMKPAQVLRGYAVVRPDGTVLVNTVRKTRAEAIAAKFNGRQWTAFREMGWTTIGIELVAVPPTPRKPRCMSRHRVQDRKPKPEPQSRL